MADLTSFSSSGRGKRGGHPQELDPQLASPPLGVVQVLVLFVFHLFVGLLHGVGHGALHLLGQTAD
jgi:hypothetical protein